MDWTRYFQNTTSLIYSLDSMQICLSNLCLKDEFSDVKFKFKLENEDHYLPAHKLLLALRSNVFKAMFYGPAADLSGEVEIRDIEFDTFTTMLRDIYTDKELINNGNAIDLLAAAHKYELSSLLRKCQDFLENSTNVDNSCLIYRWSRHLELTAFADKTLNFILENASDVFQSKKFLSLILEDLQLIFSRDDICTIEENIIHAALKWAEHYCIQNGVNVCGTTLRKALGPLIYELRIPLLSLENFAAIIVKTGILSEAEELGLYKYLTATKKSPADLCGFETKARQRASLFVKLPDLHQKRTVQNICEEMKKHGTNSFIEKDPFNTNTQRHRKNLNTTEKVQVISLVSPKAFFLNAVSLAVSGFHIPKHLVGKGLNIQCTEGSNFNIFAGETKMTNMRCAVKNSEEKKLYFYCENYEGIENYKPSQWKEVNIGSNNVVYIKVEGNISVVYSLDLSSTKIV